MKEKESYNLIVTALANLNPKEAILIHLNGTYYLVKVASPADIAYYKHSGDIQ